MNRFNGEALIHEFTVASAPYFDDEGDVLLGWYYQFVDISNEPLGALIGPYNSKHQVEGACRRAWDTRDFSFRIADLN